MFHWIFFFTLVSTHHARGANHIQSPTIHFSEETVSFNLPRGTPISAKLLVPSHAGVDTKLPVLLVFGGFEEAGKVLSLLRPTIPVILASFDYPFSPPREFKFPQNLKFAPDAKQAAHDMIVAINEFHRLLKRRNDVDPNKITLLGASFGAPFVLAAAANNSDISGLVIIHGFGDIPGTVTQRLLSNWKNRFGVFAYPMAWLLSHVGWLYFNAPSPEDSARKLESKQKVFMITAKDDSLIPQASIQLLKKALHGSKAKLEIIDLPGDHLKPGATQLISELTTLVTGWLERAELL